MMSGWLVEALGVLAAVLVAASLVMKSIITLRWVNLLGCALFVVYGVAIGSLAVWLANGFGVAVNLYRLREIYRVRSRDGGVSDRV